MYDQDRNQESFAPVKVGDEIDVKIEAVGEKGDGIAKQEGFVLFVPNTKEGQEVKIRITKVLRKVGFAEVVSGGSGEEQSAENAPAAEPSEETSEKAPTKEPAPEETPQDSEDFGEEKK